MSKQSVIPFGPQHPVLPEPIHLDLVLEDETVVEAVPSIGFVHRGLEELVRKKDFNELVYVVERTCGICSFMHGMGYCESMERIMNVTVPRRAAYLRTMWAEMSRVHSHLLWLGLYADAFGYENLFYQCWRIREKVLDMFEASTGGRCIFSVNKIGGLLKDVPDDMLKGFKISFEDIRKEVKVIADTFLQDLTVNKRLRGVAILTKEQALEMGAVGPFARGSGVEIDLRETGYSAYDELEFKMCTEKDGDAYARTKVRIDEIFVALDLINQCIDKIPAGEVAVVVKGNPSGEYLMRLEQPRGEGTYYLKANGTRYLDRLRLRTPTFANIQPMVSILKGAQVSDVALYVLSIDPCISCTER
ncbi:MAG: nickel-dependent hydrogenase large subunit [Clostridiales bacterium]|nr:nickel-dependent hydrogenase large subunit [Clostridiales bacterium]